MSYLKKIKLLVALKKIIASEQQLFAQDSKFITWLTRFLDGFDYLYDDEARGFKPEYEHYLAPFKPHSPLRIYRGLHPESLDEDWFLRLLEVDSIKQGETVVHNRNSVTSWTTSLEVAKSFSENTGCVISLVADPKNILMDTKNLYDFCITHKTESWAKEICEMIRLNEQEISLLPGHYKAKVVFIRNS
jgi:hypothetical protein